MTRNFRVFHRTWWSHNPAWPNGLEPCPGNKKFVGWAETEDEARELCKLWNRDHPRGPLSDKAEYEDYR